VLAFAAVGLAVLAGVMLFRKPPAPAPLPVASADADDDDASDASPPRVKIVFVPKTADGGPPHARPRSPRAPTPPSAAPTPLAHDEPPPSPPPSPTPAPAHHHVRLNVTDIVTGPDPANVRAVIASLTPAVERCVNENSANLLDQPTRWDVFVREDGTVGTIHVGNGTPGTIQCIWAVFKGARFKSWTPSSALLGGENAVEVMVGLAD